MNKQSLKRLHYKKILCASILITGVLVAGIMASSVAAQTDGQVTPEISYPVAELGNCADKAACKVYCDKPANIDACLSFAEKNNLMSKDEIKVAKNFKNTGMTGPGGCKGKDECKTYCSGPDHMDECVTFAEKNRMMSGKQLGEAKKVQTAIAKGVKPPACGGKENCDAYCSSSDHVEECVKFGEAAGIISKEQAGKIRKGGKGQQGQQGQQPGQGQQSGQDGQGGQGQGPEGQGPGGQGQGGGQGRGDQGSGSSGQGGNGSGGKGPGGGPGGGGSGNGGGGGQGSGGQGQGGGQGSGGQGPGDSGR